MKPRYPYYQLAFPLADTSLVLKPKEQRFETLEEAVMSAEKHPTCSYITKVSSEVVWRADQ